MYNIKKILISTLLFITNSAYTPTFIVLLTKIRTFDNVIVMFAWMFHNLNLTQSSFEQSLSIAMLALVAVYVGYTIHLSLRMCVLDATTTFILRFSLAALVLSIYYQRQVDEFINKREVQRSSPHISIRRQLKKSRRVSFGGIEECEYSKANPVTCVSL